MLGFIYYHGIHGIVDRPPAGKIVHWRIELWNLWTYIPVNKIGQTDDAVTLLDRTPNILSHFYSSRGVNCGSNSHLERNKNAPLL